MSGCSGHLCHLYIGSTDYGVIQVHKHGHLVAYVSILGWPSDSAARGLCSGDWLQLVLETEVQSPVWTGLVSLGLSSLAISGHLLTVSLCGLSMSMHPGCLFVHLGFSLISIAINLDCSSH